MTPEAMKELYRRYLDEVWTRRRVDALDQFFVPDHVDHDQPPGEGQGIDYLRAIMPYFQMAFPDASVNIDDLYVDGHALISRLTFSGTHRGEFFGIAATGRHVQIRQIHIARFRDGKMAEHWSNSDDLLLMRQLGVLPEKAPLAM